MVNIIALCIVTEHESPTCTDAYVTFKGRLEGMSSRHNTVIVHDVNSVNRLRQKRDKTNNLGDKLEKKIKESHVVFVVCSPSLKQFLDDGVPSGLLNGNERKVLLKCLQRHRDIKVVLVSLDDEYSCCVPTVLQGMKVMDGVNDLSTIMEVTIPAKYSLNK